MVGTMSKKTFTPHSKYYFMYEIYNCKTSKKRVSQVYNAPRKAIWRHGVIFPLLAQDGLREPFEPNVMAALQPLFQEDRSKKKKKCLHLMKWKTKVLSGLFLPRNKRGSSVHCVNEYRAGKETPSRLNLKPYTGPVSSIQFLHWENNSEIQCRWD